MKEFIKKLLPYLLTAAIALAVSRYAFQLTLIRGDSMLPSYHNMQFVITRKWQPNYAAGSVAVFRCTALRSILVKRIAAVPGDTVQIRDGTLFVNGNVSSVFPEPHRFTEAGILREPIVLEEGFYLMIGDNTDFSKDSRDPAIGPVPLADMVGVVIRRS